MKQSRTLAIKSVDTSVFQAKAAVGFSLIALLLPFILHLLSTPSSYPVGAKLIPLFYAPFIAVLFFSLPHSSGYWHFFSAGKFYAARPSICKPPVSVGFGNRLFCFDFQFLEGLQGNSMGKRPFCLYWCKDGNLGILQCIKLNISSGGGSRIF